MQISVAIVMEGYNIQTIISNSENNFMCNIFYLGIKQEKVTHWLTDMNYEIPSESDFH